jgi:ATP-dependent RNA helicase RhlE
MPQEIGKLAGELLRNPEHVSVTPQSTTVERIAQRVIHVSNGDKRALLVHLLRTDPAMQRTLVFTRTKHGADKIVRALDAAGIYSSALHGNKSQSQRVNTLNAFRSGRAPVLVATDIAARGIDVDGITHVINFDLPHVPESYVHRIGRTARAGAEGIAVAFCDREERPLLRDIEKVTRQQIPSSEWQADRATALPPTPVQTHEQKQEFRRQRETDRQPREEGRPHRGKPGGGGRPHQARGEFGRPNRERNEAGADRPRRDFDRPRPERSEGGADRPRRDFNGPRPQRTEGAPDRGFRRDDAGAPRQHRSDDRGGAPHHRGGKPHFAKSRDERRPFGKPDRDQRGGDRMEQAGPRPHVTVEPLSRDGRDRPRPPQHRPDGERLGKFFGKSGHGGKPGFGKPGHGGKPGHAGKPTHGSKPAHAGKPGGGRPYRGKTTTSASGNDGNRPHRRAF